MDMSSRTEHFDPDTRPRYKPRYPQVVVVPSEDRFSMMANIANGIRAAGAKQDEINQFYTEARRGTYQEFMHLVRQWVEVEFVW